MSERVTIEFIGSDGVSKPARSAAKGLGELDNAAKGAHNALASMAKQAASVALGIGVFGIVQKATAGLGNSLIGMNARLEQAEMAFTTMLGSGEKAKTFLDELAVFAARTPFEFGELVDASKRLMAFGFASKEVLPMMSAIGNAASALGGSREMINRITTALGQMASKGKVASQEMLQLAEAGIPAWDMLAKKLGTDVSGAMKLVEQRAVSAKTMIEAFQEGTASRFGDMMQKQSRTFEGAMSTVRDSLQMAIAKGFRPLFEQISAGTVASADFLSGKAFQGFVDGVAAAMARVGDLIKTIIGLGSVLQDNKAVQGSLLVVLSMVGTAYTLATARALAYGAATRGVALATSTLTALQWALNAAMTANPIGLVIVGLAGLVAATVWASQNMEGLGEKVDTTTSKWERHEGALRQTQDAMAKADAAVAKSAAEWVKYEGVLRQAQQAILARDDAVYKGINAWTRSNSTIALAYPELEKTGEASRRLTGAFKGVVSELSLLEKGVQRATVYLNADTAAMRQAEQAAQDLAAANRTAAAAILARLSPTERLEALSEDSYETLRRETDAMKGRTQGSRFLTDALGYLTARTNELRQANIIWGADSKQSNKIMSETAGLVDQLKTLYPSLTAAQKAQVSDAVSGFDSIVSAHKRAEEQLTKQGVAAAAKDLSDKIRLAKGDLSQLRDVTKLYGEDSEEARALTESLSSRLAELRGEYGSLDAVQRQQIDSLELEAQKLAQAASNWKEVGFAVEQVTQAIINQHPAVIATAAQVQVWQQRISGVNLALIANRDQMQAAQAELQGMQGHLTVLNQRLSDAKQRLTDLSAPKLTGQTEVENQIAAIQKQLERVSLAKLRGVSLDEIAAQFPILRQGMEQFVAGLPTDEGGLRKFLDILTKTKDLQFGEQLQMLGEAAKGAQTELTFDKALQGISQTKAEISSLTSEIANQEGAIRGQQSAINALQVASEGLNRVLADYQTKLRDAEEKQTLVNQALSVAYNYLLGGVRQRFIELGDEGVAQASVMDEETRKLLSSVLGAAQDTTDRSTIALKTMIKEYGDAMDKGIIAVQGSDGNSGLLGMNRILAGSIDDNTIKAAGLKQMLDSLQSKEITITTNYVSNYSSNGVPTHDYPGPAFAGQPYRIGVPEVFLPAGSVFTPPTNGYIAPTGQGGGNIIINNPTFWGMGEFEDMVLRAREKSQKRGRW